ncbi:hypothetical protein AL532_19775 [Pseudomonas monteilii]|uniref:Uncharacterized protein n=1 Tax=Pseudomonas monteilii TaxID=76759 RepID=A0A6G6V0L3_9PSED|nr:hypothetical protein AL532_19775 [Pseudomonas monteilii]MVF50175.1 hypothetical protein [Pseudomonas monteilii]QIG19088.1 hypothetical protein FY041_15660 [Pseudomonas monteilii]QIG24343.1 hypothetical protein FY043_15655 [Pseudomonas monteilii]
MRDPCGSNSQAGLHANTGAAGAMYRVACFAGKPAPTGSLLNQWVRSCIPPGIWTAHHLAA